MVVLFGNRIQYTNGLIDDIGTDAIAWKYCDLFFDSHLNGSCVLIGQNF
jgi:hypothetical protein